MKALYAAESDAMKAGARHNKDDMMGVQEMHDLTIKLGAKCPELVRYPDAAKTEDAIKSADLDGVYTAYNTPPLAIKIAGDMQLDVCYMPYQGQRGGKDADGQYFSPRTNEMPEKFDKPGLPLVLYYHGYERQGIQQPIPEEI